MSTFVLVHGAWHGAWCWYKVVAALEARGHRAIAPDLPGHGRDRTPMEKCNLGLYVSTVVAVIEAEEEPVVLVGHSLGGLTVTQVAERVPERVRSVVYLTALLAPDGQSGADLNLMTEDNPAMQYIEPGELAMTFRADGLRETFYHQCPDEDVALATLSASPEPNVILEAPMRTTELNYGRVPRVYIECTEDQAIPIAKQREWYGVVPCQRVITMETDHSPFFSAPADLVAHLESI